MNFEHFQVIGLIDPLGPTATACEMQSRAVAHIWAYGINLPSDKEMLDEIRGTCNSLFYSQS